MEEARTFSGKAMRTAEQELLGALPTDRDQAVAEVVYDLMNRINNASHNIRGHVFRMRSDLDQAMELLDGGYTVRTLNDQTFRDLQSAIRDREVAFSILAGLIGQEALRRYLAMKSEPASRADRMEPATKIKKA